MDFKDFSTKFQTFWKKFRTTIYFRGLILLMLSVLAVLLIHGGLLFCLAAILVPVTIFVIPYWLGERKVKNHAINGLVVFLIAPLIAAAILAPQVISVAQQDLAGTMNPVVGQPGAAQLQQGRVNPFRGVAGASFNFTVNVTSKDARAPTFLVVTVVASYPGLSEVDSFYPMAVDPVRTPVANYSRGVYYYVNTSALNADVHQFAFFVVTANATAPQAGDLVVITQTSWGPFVAGYWAHFAFFVYHDFVEFGFLLLGLLLILLLYWYTRKAREIRGATTARAPEPGKRAEGGGEFTCTNCGADVSEGDAKCPKCGAVFEAEAPSEPADAKA